MLKQKNKNNFNRKIKVMHVVSRLETGGLENGVINICNNLDREQFVPMICCLKGFGFIAHRLKPDVQVYNLNYPEGKDFLRPFKLACFFRKINPDIVHTHAWGQGSFGGILGSYFCGVPTVINGEHGGFFTNKYRIFIQRFLAKICDITLSVSEGLKNEVNANLRIPLKRIIVIRNGVDVIKFHGRYNTSGLKDEIRVKHGIDIKVDDFIIGCVGSLKPQKNQEMLLRVIAKIKQKGVQRRIIVILAGSGNQMDKLKKFATEHGIEQQVVFLGERKDVAEIISLLDIFVSTSLVGNEGLSNVILEAMSSGKVVIATKSLGTEEIITDSKNGFLINSNDDVALIRLISSLMCDFNSLKIIGRSAQIFIRNEYSLNIMLSNYEKLYSRFNHLRG